MSASKGTHNDTPVTHFRCTSCTRSFVVSGDVSAGEIICTCGSALQPAKLARGLYELRSSMPDDLRATHPGSARGPATSSPGIPKERDLGYGASHGHAPGHEGPTGPGDVPAT